MDELTRAVRRHWATSFRDHGFQRIGTRDSARITNDHDLLHLFNFQISSSGSRMFCVNVAAMTIFGNEFTVLSSPGFRLKKNDGREAWWPSLTRDAAEMSVIEARATAERQALPWFSRVSSLPGFLEFTSSNGSHDHHHFFQMGAIRARLGQTEAALNDLSRAVELYRHDGRPWCASYVAKAERLMDALRTDQAQELLRQWRVANAKPLRIAKLLKQMEC